jgi:hypothetical protein
MLRDNKEVVLNEVLVICRKAADHSSQALELTDDPRLAESFGRMRRRRRDDVRRVEGLVRELGYRPGEPHGDKKDLSMLATLVRQAIPGDGGQALIEKALGFEAELQDALDKALRLEWEPRVAERLRELGRSSRAHCDELKER